MGRFRRLGFEQELNAYVPLPFIVEWQRDFFAITHGHPMPITELKQSIDAIEESYEFMLAYAAQGLSGEEGSKRGEELRGFLEKSEKAMSELAGLAEGVVSDQKLEPAQRYLDFIAVLSRDADSSRSALGLVLAQESISSQLIDNLNASIHLRALLTDLFLLDELLKQHD